MGLAFEPFRWLPCLRKNLSSRVGPTNPLPKNFLPPGRWVPSTETPSPRAMRPVCGNCSLPLTTPENHGNLPPELHSKASARKLIIWRLVPPLPSLLPRVVDCCTRYSHSGITQWPPLGQQRASSFLNRIYWSVHNYSICSEHKGWTSHGVQILTAV